MVRFRGKLFQQFTVSNSTNDLRAFKQFCNRAVNELRESKKNYYNKHLDEKYEDIFERYNNIVSLKPYNLDTTLHTKDSKRSLIQAPGRIANELNLFFINVQVALHRRPLEIQNPNFLLVKS